MGKEGGRSRVHLWILCVMMICVGRRCCYALLCLPKNHAALFVFGASLFDNGNNNYLNVSFTQGGANFYPYGETFFKFPTGRFTNGRVIPDFIAEYAGLPLLLPYLFPSNPRLSDGVNFASGGSGCLVENSRGPFAIDLKTQLANLKNVNTLLRKKHGDAEADILVSNAVYLFNVGTNDYRPWVFNTSSLHSLYTADEYVKAVVGNLTSVVKDIYKMGGRKFAFVGMAPLGCIPSFRVNVNGSSCLEEANAIAKKNNIEHPLVLQKLEKKLEGFKYSFFDYYDLVDQMIHFPSKYGFKEGTKACCGSGRYNGIYSCGGRFGEYELCENPNDHVFFDSTHYSERAIQIFSEQMWSGNGNIIKPYNLKSLFEG